MNKEQMNAAKQSLTEWLAHTQELGKAPAKIECAGEFERHGMYYYIFKYKKSALGKWLLGVCGGYEGDSLEHCGHVFSQMEEYAEATATEDAIALVETVRDYFISLAKREEERRMQESTFLGFVLLKEAVWSKEAFAKQLKEDWQIEDEGYEEEKKAIYEKYPDALVFSHCGSMISAALLPGPIPNGEAEFHARSNYRWKEAEEAVKQHQAHIMVMVRGKEIPPIEAGAIFVKAVMSCCKQDGIIGIYTNGTVYEPEFYLHFANMMKDKIYPLFDLVWFGLYHGEKGLCGYTCGLRNFGYDEIEVIDSSANAQEVGNLLTDIANYVIMQNVVLRDGETIGFSEGQKLPIRKSAGVAIQGETLKIEF